VIQRSIRLASKAAAILLACLAPARADLIEYVRKPDASYAWKLRHNDTTEAGKIYSLALTSQTWQGIAWTHQLTVYEPTEVRYPDAALLFVTGGSTDRKPRPEDHALGFALAKLCGARVALLPQVPNQPLLGDRKEDDLITETFVRYLETRDANWPLLFPMVKSAVRAMDAVQELGKEQGKPVSRFVVTGASKRGWTTWLTGEVDPRVVAIAPMVIPTLNFRKQIPHQKEVYGQFSEQIEDYVRRGLLKDFDSPEKSGLWTMVDPFTFLPNLKSKPVLQINGTNDPYWTLDSMNLFWDDIPGPKFVLYEPNCGHGLDKDQGFATTTQTIGAFFRHVISGRPLPEVSWAHLTGEDGRIGMSIACEPAAKSCRLWVAKSETKDFRGSEWISDDLPAVGGDGRYHSEMMPRPETGSVALFGDLTFEIDGIDYHLSTQIRQVDPPAEKP
jgi:PhoPQ-activated pathogenicity-related protein